MAPRKPLSTAGLASSMATIAEAKALLVTRGTSFNHSFDADIAKIRPDPDQPRKLFSAEELAELAGTMQAQGQLQPILVRSDPAARGGWIIVAGERRWRAAQINGWPNVLAMEFTGDHDIATLLENLQRVDLTPVEEARGLRRLLDGKGWSQTRVAEALGKSKSEVSSLLRILDLPPDILEGVSTSKLALPRNVLAELARIAEGPARDRLLLAARAGELTLRMVRAVRDVPAASGGDPVPQTAGGVRIIGAGSLHRVADNLRALREMRCPLDAPRRDALLRVREEIDRVLAAMDDAGAK